MATSNKIRRLIFWKLHVFPWNVKDYFVARKSYASGIYLILSNLLFFMFKRRRDSSKKLYKSCFSTETDNTTEDSLIP